MILVEKGEVNNRPRVHDFVCLSTSLSIYLAWLPVCLFAFLQVITKKRWKNTHKNELAVRNIGTYPVWIICHSFMHIFWDTLRHTVYCNGVQTSCKYLLEQNLVIKVSKTQGGMKKRVMTHVGKRLLRDDVLVQGRHTDRGQITTSLKLKRSHFPWTK